MMIGDQHKANNNNKLVIVIQLNFSHKDSIISQNLLIFLSIYHSTVFADTFIRG